MLHHLAHKTCFTISYLTILFILCQADPQSWVVLCRELAFQLAEQAAALGHASGVTHATVVGGLDQHAQARLTPLQCACGVTCACVCGDARRPHCWWTGPACAGVLLIYATCMWQSPRSPGCFHIACHVEIYLRLWHGAAKALLASGRCAVKRAAISLKSAPLVLQAWRLLSATCAQMAALRKRPHFVVATPGRLADMLANAADLAAAFKRVAALVLDEADRLLESTFADALRTILLVRAACGAVPPSVGLCACALC